MKLYNIIYKTALYVAIEKKNIEIVKLLLKWKPYANIIKKKSFQESSSENIQNFTQSQTNANQTNVHTSKKFIYPNKPQPISETDQQSRNIHKSVNKMLNQEDHSQVDNIKQDLKINSTRNKDINKKMEKSNILDHSTNELLSEISNSLSKISKTRETFETLYEEEENNQYSDNQQQFLNQNQITILQQQQQDFQMIEMNNTMQAQINMSMMNYPQINQQSQSKKEEKEEK